MKYAVIIDAGSSGSRAFVYTWPDVANYLEGQSPDSVLRHALLPIETMPLWVNRIQPGISSFDGRVDRIWKDHLQPLLRTAKEVVPRNQQSETPLYFLATAGMRILTEPSRAEILAKVCSLLQRKTSFLMPECSSHVAMIDGETEGLYGWLGLNYLVHWGLSSNWHDFSDTYGFLDMGGASAQLAFASSAESAHLNDLHTVRIRTASGDPVEWHLFVTTWLGFGANQARARFREGLVADLSAAEIAQYESEGVPVPVVDPCLPHGAVDIADVKMDANKRTHCVFHGSGQWEECERRVLQLLNHDVACEDDPCLFDGVHVPDFDLTKGKYVGVSEYWYTLQDIFKHNGRFDYAQLEPQVASLCSGEWTDIIARVESGEFSRGDGSALTEEDVQRACFKSAWVLTVLSKGFNFPLSPENPALDHNFQDTFQSAMEIEGKEISWTLGRAVLYASSQIPPSPGHESERVGITTRDHEFIDGGASLGASEGATELGPSSPWSPHFGLVLFLLLLLAAAFGLLLKLTPLGPAFKKWWPIKRLRRQFRAWMPSAEQKFQERTASSIGYGNSFPHAGIPLADLAAHPSQAVSTSRPPVRTPSRVGSRLDLSGHD